MSEFKGTKSKWGVAGSENTFVYALNEKGTNSFSFSINNDGKRPIEEQQANALLISKAPEMLETIKLFIDDFDEGLIEDFQYARDRLEKIFKEATEL